MPRHQADSTSSPAPGKRMRTRRIVSSRLLAVEAGRDRVDQPAASRARRTAPAPRWRAPGGRPPRPATRPASSSSSRASRLRVHRDEGGRQHALAEQVLQEVRDAEGGVERVGGVRQAEVVREDALAHQAQHAAQQDAGGDQEGETAGAFARRFLIGQVTRLPESVLGAFLSRLAL